MFINTKTPEPILQVFGGFCFRNLHSDGNFDEISFKQEV